ncbi:MAG: KDGP aldolase [Angelakisella sp.]|nr:KDGP aldolase [Angelakisella sp.]
MSFERLDFYRDKVIVNLLARDLDNAVEVADVLDGHVLVGVLTKNYSTVNSCVSVVKEYMKKLTNVSVGLGAGDPKQWKMVAEVAAQTDPGHANEVFTGAMYCQGALAAAGCTNTIVNCLISPTGIPGKVKISTGPVSSQGKDLVVDVEDAMALMKDLGLPSIKYFDIHGTAHLEELKVVADAAVKAGIPVMEPTGGIAPDNLKEIVKICHDAGCEKIIPHVYSSIINKETKLTQVDLVKKIYEDIKTIF